MTSMQGKNRNFVARMWRWFWTATGSVVFSVISGGAIAQSPPLEIPFVKEWAVSPHARSNAEAFNHWNAEKEVPAACARCHSTPGFLDYIGADGTGPGSDGPAPVGTVISCVACHNEVTIDMTSVTFPSGALIENAGDDARCMTCHQGRESTLSVDKALTGKDDDTPDEKLKFINVHYSAAGAPVTVLKPRAGMNIAVKPTSVILNIKITLTSAQTVTSSTRSKSKSQNV